MKIITVIGARPQFIKAATVSRIIDQYEGITEKIIHTGQHFDQNMSEIFFDELDIPKPDYNLNVNNLNHGSMTGQMLEKIEKVLLNETPEWMLVYGDTNSTLAGALAAQKLHINVAHVEAGLRSYNKKMPEEINRIVTDHISDILFTPTTMAIKNLKKEGISSDKIVPVGDVMYDASLYYAKNLTKEFTVLERYKIQNKKYLLCTVHRAENTDIPERLEAIFKGLEDAAQQIEIIMPLHPRTKIKLESIGFNLKNSRINFINPVGYLDMIVLEKNAKLIVTDSGGIQKEAYFHKVPCLTLRNETEWIELVEKGYNSLLIDLKRIPEQINLSLQKEYIFNANSTYGQGNSANLIVETLVNYNA